MSAAKSVANLLRLYHGPCATIRIQPNNTHFTISKPLLAKQSPYFAALFKQDRPQGQAIDITEIEGVLSVQSFTALISWLYWHKVELSKPGSEPSDQQIAAAIELARLAEMCGIPDGLDAEMAEYIRNVLDDAFYPQQPHTHNITEGHIAAAGYLPEGHAVRRMLAAASVREFLLREGENVERWAREYPIFGAELLLEVKRVLGGLSVEDCWVVAKDPITFEGLNLLIMLVPNRVLSFLMNV